MVTTQQPAARAQAVESCLRRMQVCSAAYWYLSITHCRTNRFTANVSLALYGPYEQQNSSAVTSLNYGKILLRLKTSWPNRFLILLQPKDR